MQILPALKYPFHSVQNNDHCDTPQLVLEEILQTFIAPRGVALKFFWGWFNDLPTSALRVLDR